MGGDIDWLATDLQHVWHPYTQMLTAPPPLPVVGAEGAYFHLRDGRRVLDGTSSAWVNIHGYNHPRLNRALANQVERFAQVPFTGFTHETAARLAGELARRSPGGLQRVFFSDDGSTAVEVALKMSYQLWRNRGEKWRTLFVAFDDAYHGETLGAMAAGGLAGFLAGFSPLFFESRRARTPSSAKRGSSSPSLAEILERDGDQVAAVILEPILQGAGGMRIHDAAFLREVREETRRRGIPLIADEVLTGFGRTGRLFACEHGPVEPDLLCLSNALTAGYLPMAVTVTTEEVYAAFLSEDRSRTFSHGHSFSGNALSCAVALESLALFDDEDRLGRIARLERLFTRRLKRLRANPQVAEARGTGAVAVLELRAEGGDAAARVCSALLDRGVLLQPLGNVLYFMPPYVITDGEANGVFDALDEVLAGLD